MIAALYSFFNLNPLYFLIMIEFNSNIVIEIYICIVLEMILTYYEKLNFNFITFEEMQQI